jgi:hypothetical protein
MGLPFTAEIEDITDQIPRKGTWEEFPKWKIVRGVYHWKDGTTTKGSVSGKSPVIIPSGFRPFDFDVVDTIVVHHFASEASLENNCLHYYNNTEEPSLPYHMVIDSGRLLQVNDLMSMTFHCGGYNTNTIGISIRGNLKYRPMTERERELLYIGILSIKAAVPTIKYIKGHNEINPSTECPCISMDTVREDISKLELHLKATQDPNKVKEDCFKAINQHIYLYGEYQKDPAGHKWLETQLLEIHKKMDELGLYFGK